MLTARNPHRLVSNYMLSCLSREQYSLLFSNLQLVRLERGQILYDLGGSIRAAFFIMSGMVSLLATTEDGSTTQVGIVGDEGVVGLPPILGIDTAPYQVTMQIPGRAMRVRTDIFVKEFHRDGPLQKMLLRYLHCLICQISQSAACNRFHTLEQRLSRWLLVSQDRIRSKELLLTQEVLAHMLGAPRTNVTKAANKLRDWRVIQYHHGRIQILDRSALEGLSCECYRILTEEISCFRAA